MVQYIVDPFPYMIIDDIIPSIFYNKLCLTIDNFDNYVPSSQLGRSRDSGFDARTIYPLEDNDENIFIRDLRSALISGVLPPVLKEYSALEGTLFDQSSYVLDVALVRDLKGFRLYPHTDAKVKIFTLLIYIQTDGDPTKLGTRIYKNISDISGACDMHHENEKAFELSSVRKFFSNRGVFFARSDSSFHGVDCTSCEFHRRDIITITAYKDKIPGKFVAHYRK